MADYSRCFAADISQDPCKWGLSSSNTSSLPVAFSNMTTSRRSGLDSNSSVVGTVGDAGGWKPLSSNGIVVLPGILALLSLFFVNTVEHFHLSGDAQLSVIAKIFLKVRSSFDFLALCH
jgi:hypothetical protein